MSVILLMRRRQPHLQISFENQISQTRCDLNADIANLGSPATNVNLQNGYDIHYVSLCHIYILYRTKTHVHLPFFILAGPTWGLVHTRSGDRGSLPFFLVPIMWCHSLRKNMVSGGDVEYERQGFIMPMFIPCFDYIIPTLDKVRTCTHFGESQNGPFSTHNRKWDNNMFYMFLITYPRVNERRRGKWPIYG